MLWLNFVVIFFKLFKFGQPKMKGLCLMVQLMDNELAVTLNL